ncbi:Hypothetical protein D9617_24g017220 [Elsinoe fawcettii]|nr:Hypothetical protein D9617_24g017220 [Elsinoe fawcettii]
MAELNVTMTESLTKQNFSRIPTPYGLLKGAYMKLRHRGQYTEASLSLSTLFYVADSLQYDEKSQVYRQYFVIESNIPIDLQPNIIKAGPDSNDLLIAARLRPEPKHIFRFLDLPAEIRSMIISGALVEDIPIRAELDRRAGRSFGDLKIDTRIGIAMLRLNKSIHREAASLLYGMNSFTFSTTTVLGYFMEMTEAHFSYVTNLTVETWIVSSRPRAVKGLSSCLPFQSIDIPCYIKHRLLNDKELESIWLALRPHILKYGSATADVDRSVLSIKILGCGSGTCKSAWRFTTYGSCDSCRVWNELRRLALESAQTEQFMHEQR